MEDIVLITIDSLRQDHVGCYGYERNTTPNIDDLARQACLFQNAFSNACVTRTSFPSILTSSYASMYGGHERMSSDRTIISELLSGAGYDTAGLHSNLYLSGDFGYSRGFDVFYDSHTNPSFMSRLKQFIKSTIDNDGRLYRTLSHFLETAERQAGINIGSPYVPADEITDRSIEAVDDLATSSSGKFLWTHYMDVHHPYTPPKESQLEFRENPISERKAIQLRRKMMNEPKEIESSELTDLIDLYDAEIRFTDREIGRLITAIYEAWGEDTGIIVTSDHGEEFRDHGGFSHYPTFYEEVISVPLIVDMGEASGQYDELVSLIDIPPTIADYADIEAPKEFHGESVLKTVRGEDWPHTHVIGEALDGAEIMKLMARQQEWKYIESDSDAVLYDLSNDPKETSDVSDSNPEIVSEMKEKLRSHRQLVNNHSSETEEVEMDNEVKQRLRQLGYKE